MTQSQADESWTQKKLEKGLDRGGYVRNLVFFDTEDTERGYERN